MTTQPENDPRSARVLRMYRWFLSGRKGKTAEVAAHCAAGDKRKALADLKLLVDEGAIVARGEGVDRIYELPSTTLPRELDLHDAIALLLGKQVTSFLGGVGLNTVFERLAFDRSLDVRRRSHFEGKFICLHEPERVYDEVAAAVLPTIVRALIEERAVELDYRHGGGEIETLRHFQPLSLALYRRGIYILGRCPGERAHRSLALERFVRVVLGEAVEYPAGWDPQRVLRQTFGVWTDGPVERVRLRFPAARAHLVWAREWVHGQVITELPEGGVELCFQARGKELVRFCLEWGPAVTVIEPAWLREAVVAELRAALANYPGEA